MSASKLQRTPVVLHTATPTMSIPIDSGVTEVIVQESAAPLRWCFEVTTPSVLKVDFLAPHVFSVQGAAVVAVPQREYVPHPRLRMHMNNVAYEIVSTDAAVLERHYTRPNHQAEYQLRDSWTEQYHEARRRQCRRLLRGIAGRVCDVGSGYSLVHDTRPWPFALFACDRDPGAVKALLEWGVDARLGDAEDPPFEKARFDAVYAGEIVEHLARPHEALRRWVELLRPGGRLVVTTPNRRHLLARVRRFELVENPEHLFEWDAHEFRGAVRDAGASVDTLEGLALPTPVYVPGRGWRDLIPAVSRRWGSLPVSIARATLESGRLVPSVAANLAISAHRVG